MIVQEKGLYDFRLVAEAKYEASEAMAGIASHQMPQNGHVSYRNHGLRPCACFLFQAGTQAATQDENRYVRRFGHILLPAQANFRPALLLLWMDCRAGDAGEPKAIQSTNLLRVVYRL